MQENKNILNRELVILTLFLLKGNNMNLIIFSYSLFDEEIQEHLNDMKKIKAKNVTKDYNNISKYQFVHEINFNKDLKFSEIIKIKKELEVDNSIECVTIEDDNGEDIILFNKSLR